MFDSRIKVTDLIAQIRDEAEISYEVSEASFVQWLNSVEQLLYSEIIKEQKEYSFGVSSHLLKTPVNLCPLLEVQGDSDTVVTMVSPGVYNIKAADEKTMATLKGLNLEKEFTLPAGTYTMSDNVASRVDQAMIIKPGNSTSDTLASLSPMNSTSKGATFTLTADTKVIMRIRINTGRVLGANGYTVSPQIELGSTNTAFIPPIALAEEVPPLVCGFPKYDDEADMRFEDIHAVYADGKQLIRTTLTSGAVFPNAYYKELDSLGMNISGKPDEIKVVYLVRPAPKDADVLTDNDTVKVPVEFIDLVTAKLRGEAYKLSNEDALAAKWLNDYNIRLETFKAWVEGKQPSFGI